jgi:hypothetical protein
MKVLLIYMTLPLVIIGMLIVDLFSKGRMTYGELLGNHNYRGD